MRRSIETRRSSMLLAPAILLLAAAAAAQPPAGEPPPRPPEDAFDWTRGVWEGTRRDGDDGSEAPMRLSVTPILEGAGLSRELRIAHDGGVYRGLSLVMMEPESGRWYEIYVNDVHRRFVRLEGEIEESGESGAERSVWRPADPSAGRLSELTSERIDAEHWRRTMRVSEDGGETWRVLWLDELKRRRGF